MFTKFEKWLLIISLGVVISLLIFSNKTHLPNEKHLNQYSQQVTSIKDSLDLWIDELEEYECRNCPLGFSKIDNNKLRSYGCLQFQMPTFKQYYKKYYPEVVKNMEEEDWLNQIYDCDIQKELTYKMLKDNWGNWKHWNWSITVRGLKTPPKK